MPWYFAFGSNLNMVQMRTRVVEWQDAKRALLKFYKLTFNKFSKTRWGGGVADIVDSNEKVYGAVYLISQKQLDIMANYEVGYEPLDVTVECENEPLEAKTFTVINKDRFYPPSEKYIGTILEGFSNHNYSDKIIRDVESKIRSMISDNK